MRAVLPVLLLLAPSVLASTAFGTREGVLSVSCPGSLYAGALGSYTPAYGCDGRVTFPAGSPEGAYVAELSWVPAEKPVTVMACLSTTERVASASGNEVWVFIAHDCQESATGSLTLRQPASSKDGRVTLSVQLEPGARNSVGFYCCLAQDVSYKLSQEP